MADRVLDEDDQLEGAPGVEKTAFRLAAVLTPTYAGEERRLQTLRVLSPELGDEAVRAGELLQRLGSIRPYARAAHLFDDLEQLIESHAAGPLDRARGAKFQVAVDALLAAISAVPDELVADVVEHFGQGSEETLDVTAHARAATGSPTWRFAETLRQAHGRGWQVARGHEDTTLVLQRDHHVVSPRAPRAAKDEDRRDLDALAILNDAVLLAQHVTAMWLLQYEARVRDASLLVRRLGADAIAGEPVVLEHVEPEVADPSELQLSIHGLSIEHVLPLQQAMRAARALLDEDGPDDVTDEVPDSGGPEDGDDDAYDDDDLIVTAVDLEALVRHIEAGARRLEQAWSRALLEDDREELLCEWYALIESVRGAMRSADERLGEAGHEPLRIDELPLPLADVASVEMDPGASARRRQLALAEVYAMVALAEALEGLQVPSNGTVDFQAGTANLWFSAGAWAGVRAWAGLLLEIGVELRAAEQALIKDVSAVNSEPWLGMLSRGRAAHDRGDPGAALLHARSAIASRWTEPLGPPFTGPMRLSELAAARGYVEHSSLLEKIDEAVLRLSHGRPPDVGQLVLLAPAGLSLATDICTADPPN